MTLADVLRAAMREMAAQGQLTLFPRDAAVRGSVVEDHIAAAVARWLAEPATVERMLSALVREMHDAGLDFDHLYDASEHPLHRDRDDVLTAIRAAISAIVGRVGGHDDGTI